ncbi:glutathionylspermidine synthase family protein, partial [Streptomyces sp. PGLac3x]
AQPPAPAPAAGPSCYQQLALLPDLSTPAPGAHSPTNHVVLGAWVVADEAAGLGIRESAGPVTDGYARFVPHVIL